MNPARFYDSHTHTWLCSHAEGEPIDYAKTAARIGLTGLIVTDHNPTPHGWEPDIRMSADQFALYRDMVSRARQAWSGIVDVRLGIESDFVPEHADWLEKFHASAPFDFVLGSVHCNTKSYLKEHYRGDVDEYTAFYYKRLGDAAESGLFDALSHPDVPKFMWPDRWDFEKRRPLIERFLDRVAVAGLPLELNTSGLLKPYPEMNPGPEFLRLMRERDIPVFVGSDAHLPERVGDGFPQAFDLLEAAGYTEVCYYLKRERQTVAIRDVRDLLAGGAPE